MAPHILMLITTLNVFFCFNIYSKNYLVKFLAEGFENEPFKVGKSGSHYDDLDHVHTYNLPQNTELLAEFRKVLDNKTAEDIYNPRSVLTLGSSKDE